MLLTYPIQTTILVLAVGMLILGYVLGRIITSWNYESKLTAMFDLRKRDKILTDCVEKHKINPFNTEATESEVKEWDLKVGVKDVITKHPKKKGYERKTSKEWDTVVPKG